jgi:hypothetical protein
MKTLPLLPAFVAACLFTSAAFAQERLTISAGAFGVDDNSSANFALEYRGASFWHDLQPMLGIQVNEDGGVYGYAGLNYDWEFAQNWYLIPNVAVGAYDDHDSADLGGTLEFRSGIELDYAFANAHRLGLAFHHISNAGIYDDNPGTEQVMLTYSIPVSIFK